MAYAAPVDLVATARAFARRAYGSEDALAHPLEVAGLVDSAGSPEEVVAAALLHDVVEDTEVEVVQITAAFGSRIAALVASLTEDDSIRSYSERKADLRTRSVAAGPEAALIAVADKLSNARRMKLRGKAPKERKVAHYEATLALVRGAYPDLPLLDQLGRELGMLRADLVHAHA
jgi:guanosine-3',5'-bis(diphosphate) 3'-pyrophosphohydrolase